MIGRVGNRNKNQKSLEKYPGLQDSQRMVVLVKSISAYN